MDDLTRAYYQQAFEIRFLESKGDDFQRFFERLMGTVHKGDWMSCRPWGDIGDMKNDGFLRSEGSLFQVYAPNEMKAATVVKKIVEDLDGAKAAWGNKMRKWVFVHNSHDSRLSAPVHQVILEAKDANPHIAIETWGKIELLEKFQKLTAEDLRTWFGPMPDRRTQVSLGYGDLQPVLERIAGGQHLHQSEVKPVPRGKLEANALSESVAVVLRSGMTKAPLVRRFFEQWHDETYGERIAAAFRERYEALRDSYGPDDVFHQLEIWAGGDRLREPMHRLAVDAIIAYFFDTCNIFEAPRERPA